MEKRKKKHLKGNRKQKKKEKGIRVCEKNQKKNYGKTID